jgi:hypothetical protein
MYVMIRLVYRLTNDRIDHTECVLSECFCHFVYRSFEALT